MRHSVRIQRTALQARLLCSAAAAAASSAALADQAPAADPQKWNAYSSIGGSAGTGMVAGKLDFFVPLFQNTDSLVFLNLGVGTETKANVLYNVGLGYRTEIDADWIVGVYAGHDGTQLDDNNTFGQTALGAELMSADWDVRLNGYLADNKPKPVPGQFGLYIAGTTIAVLQAQEVGYTGFDGEIGYRVFANDQTEVRVFIGGFSFMHDDTNSTSSGEPFDFSYRDITGPKARAEVTVYDLDALGNQSRLTLEGEIAHDDVRGTTGFVGATLRIPLGDFSGGGGAQALGELDRRMVDPERRNDTVLTRVEFTKPEPVIIYGSGVKSQPTNTLLYVDNTQGVGTYANPTTFSDAIARPTENAFIVLTSKQGPVMGGGTLQPGQTVVAGGETFSVQGVYSHATFSHLFDPSVNVTLMPSHPGANVITLSPNDSIHGFTIKGDFGNAIYGKNVQNVSINDVTIDGTGGGQNGIDIVRTVSGTQTVSIANTSIANVSGSGILFNTNVSDGGTSKITTTFNNVAVTHAGGYGINVYASAGGGSKITSNVSLSNVNISATRDSAIDDFDVARGTGSMIGETLAVANGVLSGPQDDGIFIAAYASGGAQIASHVSLSGMTISGAGEDGIELFTHAILGGAAIDQTLSAANVTVDRSGFFGVKLDNLAVDGAITSNASLSNVAVDGAAFGGIYSYAGGQGTGANVNRTLTIANASVTNTGDAGISLVAGAQAGASMTDVVSLTNTTVAHDHYNGAVEAAASSLQQGSTLEQTLSFSNLSVSGAGEVGVHVSGYASSGGLTQNVSIANATISGIGGPSPVSYGVFIGAKATDSGYVHQSSSVTNAVVSEVSGKYANVGIGISANAQNGGAVVQSASIASSSASNSGEGLYIVARAADNGMGTTTVDQQTTVTNGSFDDNALRGVAIYGSAGSNAAYHSQAAIYQGVTITGTTMDHNGAGFLMSDVAYSGASVTETANLTGVDISYNRGDGADLVSTARTQGFAAQNATFNGSTSSYNRISYNGHDGVFIEAHAYTGGQTQQHFYLYYTDIDHNKNNGVHAVNTAIGYQVVGSLTYYAHVDQNVLTGQETISHNNGNGIAFYNTAKYGAQIDQIVSVYKETVDHNGGAGFLENSTSTTFNGSGSYRPTGLHSNVYFYNSDFSFNGGAGISVTSNLKSPQYAVTAKGYSYLEQHVTVSGVTANHNKGAGFIDNASDSGVFGINLQYVTLSGSTFDSNHGNGASFIARQFYGPGSFGATEQIVTITGSDFSHNSANGLYAYAYAGGNQGRTEQHFTLQPLAVSATSTIQNYFDNNGQNGIDLRRIAQNGVYVSGFPCTAVQGLAGGCAFVRQTFDMFGGVVSGNAQNGISVFNYANNFGAIYDESGRPHAPEIYLSGVQLEKNAGSGFVSSTTAANASYAASFVVAVDTVFDKNAVNGFVTIAYATKGSGIIEHNILYSYVTGTSASGNGGNGVLITDRATLASAVLGQNGLYGHSAGIAASNNGLNGVVIATGYDDPTSTVRQVNILKDNTISHNHHDGVSLLATGNGVGMLGGGYQASVFLANTITANGHYGLSGLAAHGATQVINVYTGGNTISGNGIANFHFLNAGALQVVY